MFRVYQKPALAVCFGIVVCCSLFFKPVRVLADQFLSVFRVEKVQTITITPAELDQINKVFQENHGSVLIRNFGEIHLDGKPQAQAMSTTAIQQRFPEVILPQTLAGGYAFQNATLTTPGRMTIKIDIKRINAFLRDIGATKLLPSELEGQNFEVRIPEVIAARYRHSATQIMLLETKSPELEMPDAVSPLAVRDALLELPFLPAELAGHLRSVTDWQHTLIIPRSEDTTLPVNINGTRGYYCSAVKNLAIMTKFFPELQTKLKNHPVSENAGFLLWQYQQQIFVIIGNAAKDTLVALAEQIR